MTYGWVENFGSLVLPRTSLRPLKFSRIVSECQEFPEEREYKTSAATFSQMVLIQSLFSDESNKNYFPDFRLTLEQTGKKRTL